MNKNPAAHDIDKIPPTVREQIAFQHRVGPEFVSMHADKVGFVFHIDPERDGVSI